MSPHLHIQLLGDFRCLVDERPLIHLKKPRQQALVAYVLLHRYAPQTRQQIAFALWPDSSEAQAYTNLRKILFQLRHEVPDLDHFLVSDGQCLGWRAAGYTLDVAELEEALAALGQGAPQEALERVLALYGGELLPTCYDEWLISLRRQLHERVLKSLQQALDSLEATEREQTALAAAEQLLRLDPLDETTYRRLMRLRAGLGDRSGALRLYQACVAMLEQELAVMPARETTTLYQTILMQHLEEQEAATPAPEHSPTPREKLPTQLTPFVGREQELEALDVLLASEQGRLITIVGPGGMGKTRLALQAARRQLAKAEEEVFAHGVYFVGLVALSEAAQIVPTLAAALGFAIDATHGQERSPEQQLLDYLREKKMLLLLDNFEHLLEGVGLLAAILEAAPEVRLLITSRERLRLPGEQLYPIGGLALGKGESTAAGDEPDAVTLFLQCARRLLPNLALSAAEMNDAARLCRLVEGMPLAIELAAAWVETLSPAEIVSELQQSLDFLAIERQGERHRHDSMRAVFDATWQRLAAEERALFACLSIFRAGFTREAAQSIADATLPQLNRLVGKCLINHIGATNRYALHELLRQYGALRLAETPALEATARDRHSDYYVALLQRWQERLKGREQPAALAALDAEQENISLAWRWAIAQGRRDALAATLNGLGLYMQLRYLAGEGVGLFEAAAHLFEQLGETKLLVQALNWQAAFLLVIQQFEKAEQLLVTNFELLDSAALAGEDTRGERAFALLQKGLWAVLQGYWVNHSYYAQSLALFEEVGDLWNAAQALLGLYEITFESGNFGELSGYLQRAIACYRKLGNERALSLPLALLASVERHRGRPHLSLSIATESLAAARHFGDAVGEAQSLCSIGLAHLELGDADRARLAILEGAARYAEVGYRHDEYMSYSLLSPVELAAGNYHQARAFTLRGLEYYGPREHHPEAALWYAVLGWATLYTGTTEEALAILNKAFAIEEATGGAHNRCWVSVLLAFGEWRNGLGQLARRHCLSALRLVITFMDQRLVSVVLSPIMALLAEEEDPYYALQLYALLCTIPFCAAAAWWRDTAGARMEALIAQSPPELVEAALQRGRSLELEQTATGLVEKLNALGWES